MAATQSPSSQIWAETRGVKWRDQLDPMEAMLTPIDAPLKRDRVSGSEAPRLGASPEKKHNKKAP